MAGHSKWANIKFRKERQDKKRSSIFGKLIKEITLQARNGDPNPENNPGLAQALERAKAANLPKDNIERAIKRATGELEGITYEEATYEGYATHGVAVFVECLTDNTNRTVSSVRAGFTKNGGSLGTNGSLEFIFDRKGVFHIKMEEGFDEDEFTLEMIDGGAEDVTSEDGYLTVTCELSDFGTVQKKLEDLSVEAENAELQRIPNTLVTLDDDSFTKVMKMIEMLEDNDDVQKVFHNLDITEAQMELI